MPRETLNPGAARGARAGHHVAKRRAEQWRPSPGFHECDEDGHYACGGIAPDNHECVRHMGWGQECWDAYTLARGLADPMSLEALKGA